MGRMWTAAEDEYIRLSVNEPLQAVAERLGRSVPAINTRRRDLGARSEPKWTNQADEIIRTTLSEPARIVAERLGMTVAAVGGRRWQLGLKGMYRRPPQFGPRVDRTRVCPNCTKPFTPERDRNTFCSMRCAGIYSAARQYAHLDRTNNRTCRYCGKEFTVKEARLKGAYCSRLCFYQGTPTRKPGKQYDPSTPKIRTSGLAKARARKYGVEYIRINPLLVFKRDRWRCQMCGIKTPEKLRGTDAPNAPELDHRIPMAMGGNHTYDNVQCACRLCNRKKSGYTIKGQLSLFPIVSKSDFRK